MADRFGKSLCEREGRIFELGANNDDESVCPLFSPEEALERHLGNDLTLLANLKTFFRFDRLRRQSEKRGAKRSELELYSDEIA